MREALEKKLYLDIDEKDFEKIVSIFALAKTIQLPVVKDEKVVGIIDLFKLLKVGKEEILLDSIMETDFVTAGGKNGMFSFKNARQQILPFVDEEGKFVGFVNKLFQKCYLPTKEYMQVVERELEIDFSRLSESNGGEDQWFDAIIESNYDGIYVTVGKGKTFSINERSKYIQGVSTGHVGPTGSGITEFSDDDSHSSEVTIIQNLQNKKEVSVSDEMTSEGGIIRIIENVNDLDKLKNELVETQRLAIKYQDELAAIQNERTKSTAIVAESFEMKKVVDLALKVSKVDSTILVHGQSGTGKGVLTKLIHENSDRREGPLVKIDCSAIPDALLESELFGYEKGSFTGAEKEGKKGLVELASGGTLFLDEIGELPLPLQTKLLRVIQDKEFLRVGGKKTCTVDVRFVAATNRDLGEMVKEKTFREDLYYRLNVVPIVIPPLKERKEDIRPLIEKCLKRFNEKYGYSKKLDPIVFKYLIDYSWPGNVRELENYIEYLVVTSNSSTIVKESLSKTIVEENIILNSGISVEKISSLKEAMDLLERELLVEAMEKTTNMEEMGEILKVDRSTIVRKLQKHGIKRAKTGNV